MNAECPRCKDNAVPVTVTFSPGKTSGPPEDCYPSEFEVVTIGDCEECGATGWSREEQDQIEASAAERHDPNEDVPEPPEWDPEWEPETERC